MIQLIDISSQIRQYENEITSFLNRIPYQTEFFDLPMGRFFQSKLCIISKVDDELAGMVGLLPRKGIMSVYIVVEKKFQGKGIARNLSTTLIEVAKNKYHLLAAMVEYGNNISLNLHQRIGYKLIGKRNNFYYTFLPLDTRGRIILTIIKIIFPVIIFMDRFRP